jgi:hypothetical protein
MKIVMNYPDALRPMISQSVSQSVNQPAGQWVSRLVSHSVSQPASHSISQPVNQSVTQSTNFDVESHLRLITRYYYYYYWRGWVSPRTATNSLLYVPLRYSTSRHTLPILVLAISPVQSARLAAVPGTSPSTGGIGNYSGGKFCLILLRGLLET